VARDNHQRANAALAAAQTGLADATSEHIRVASAGDDGMRAWKPWPLWKPRR
jgi:hypothetical protein